MCNTSREQETELYLIENVGKGVNWSSFLGICIRITEKANIHIENMLPDVKSFCSIRHDYKFNRHNYSINLM